MAVKFKRNEILSIDNFDLSTCYQDLWKTDSEKRNAMRQGIIHSSGCTLNCIKMKTNAVDKSDSPAEDKAIASA